MYANYKGSDYVLVYVQVNVTVVIVLLVASSAVFGHLISIFFIS